MVMHGVSQDSPKPGCNRFFYRFIHWPVWNLGFLRRHRDRAEAFGHPLCLRVSAPGGTRRFCCLITPGRTGAVTKTASAMGICCKVLAGIKIQHIGFKVTPWR